MGWNGGGRGGRGHPAHRQRQSGNSGGHGGHWKRAGHPHRGADDGGEEDGEGEEAEAQRHQEPVPPPLPQPLTVQWRFASRVLRRHSPEERVHDPRRQLRLGDHVFVQYSWDFSEQHGLVCSVASSEDAQSRRGSREESHWIVHWDADGSRLHCSSLPQFSQGGEVFRIAYPLWTCQCYLPVASTVKPHILGERHLEASSGEAVARRANAAYRNGSWTPRWGQGADLEFCLATATGSDSLPWEVHLMKTLTRVPVSPIGWLVRGDSQPSRLFGAGGQRQPAHASGGAWAQGDAAASADSHVFAASACGSYVNRGYNAGYGAEGYGWDQSWHAWTPQVPQPGCEVVWAPQCGQQANAQDPNDPNGLKQMSPNAQEFVPWGQGAGAPSAASWDGIYQ